MRDDMRAGKHGAHRPDDQGAVRARTDPTLPQPIPQAAWVRAPACSLPPRGSPRAGIAGRSDTAVPRASVRVRSRPDARVCRCRRSSAASRWVARSGTGCTWPPVRRASWCPGWGRASAAPWASSTERPPTARRTRTCRQAWANPSRCTTAGGLDSSVITTLSGNLRVSPEWRGRPAQEASGVTTTGGLGPAWGSTVTFTTRGPSTSSTWMRHMSSLSESPFSGMRPSRAMM